MKRMTEEELAGFLARVQTRTDLTSGSTSALVQIESELDRARREETRLAEENNTQAEQIKALLDALELLRKTGHDNDRRTLIIPLIDALLRAHGRTP